jgi:hypothetical protein
MMAALVTTVWIGMLGISYIVEKRPSKAPDAAAEIQK